MNRTLLAVACTAVLAAGAATSAATAAPAPAAPRFAPAATATVHPGVQTVTGGAQCTANFVFTDRLGRVYLGQSAHCAGTGGATDTDGCLAASLPLGTPVEVAGAGRPGRLAYSSWLAMARAGEQDADTCGHNDFALIALDPADVARTNPSVPVFGGPVAVDTDGTHVGESVLTYGGSSAAARPDRHQPQARRVRSVTARAAGPTPSSPRPRASPATPARACSTAPAARPGRSAPSACSRCRAPTASATCPASWRTPAPTGCPAWPSCRARSGSPQHCAEPPGLSQGRAQMAG